MTKILYLLGGTALALAVFAILNSEEPLGASVGSVGDRLTAWGTKQRLGGAGGQVVGKVKEGVANLTGDPDTANQGAFDQAAGTVKDAVGSAAQSIGNTLRNVNS